MSLNAEDFPAALAHHKAGRHAAAASLYRRVLAGNPDHSGALTKLGALAIAERQFDEAARCLRRVLELAPDDADALANLGNLMQMRGEPMEAECFYRKALEARPGYAATRFNLANLYLGLDRLQEAEDEFRQVLTLNPGSVEAHAILAAVLWRRGLADQALTCFRECLSLDAENLEALGGIAELLLRRGHVGEALPYLETYTQRVPGDAEGEFQIANLYLHDNQYIQAVAHHRRALVLAADRADIHLHLGSALHALGRYDEAIAANERAVALQPDLADAFNNLGNCYMANFRAEDAVSAYRRALDCQASALTACNLAHALRGLVRLEEAEHWFNEALRLDPEMAGAHNGLGNGYRDRGEYDMAKGAYARALALDPNNADVLHNMTVVLVEMGEIEEALAVARRAVAANPGFGTAHVSLGRALAAQHRHQEAVACYETALGLDADNIDGLLLLAKSYEQLWLADRASETYRRVLALAPGHFHALCMLLDAVLSLCDWQGYQALSEQLTERLEEAADGEIDSVSIFNLQALPLPYATIARAARQSAAAIGRSVAAKKAACRFTRAPREGGRVRVGYLLPYTFRHSLPEVLKTIVECHDCTRFEIFGYSKLPDDGSAFGAAYRRAFDRFTDVGSASPVGAAHRINSDGIDILVDVAGQTPSNCLQILALEPAPVQVHFLGYSITTGADYVHYLISDRTFMPDRCAKLCAEKLAFLPDSFMTAPKRPAARHDLGRADIGLPDGAFVIVNFNHPCKFDPEMFAAWMRILGRVPGSVLWLGDWIAATATTLRAAAAEHGVDPARLVFAPITDHATHAGRLRLADLALDTLYHGGGVTTIDALAANLPVLTVAGEAPSARLGATLLTAVGLPSLIFPDVAAYEEAAVALAHDPARLTRIREQLADDGAASPLFDTARYTRHLECAYDAMWQRCLAGDEPATITVPR